ncbi:MAG TPA: hypothetical protein VK498_00355 [Ferruginibacter sp.]|nr:hypothetical protein [Ferruginibacter sp.]
MYGIHACYYVLLVLLFIVISVTGYSQMNNTTAVKNKFYLSTENIQIENGLSSEELRKNFLDNLNSRSINIGDSVFILLGVCKNNSFISFPGKVNVPVIAILEIPGKEVEIPFIKVHGNILYNFSYRSYIDTPFAQNDLVQHMVQTSLNFVIKDKYPVKMLITNRNSNSPYFKDITDINLQFNRRQLLDNIKADMRGKTVNYVNTTELINAQKFYKEELQNVQQLNEWINSPARIQELVEEKERGFFANNPIRLVKPTIPVIENTGKFNGRGINPWFNMMSEKLKDSLSNEILQNKHAIKDSSKLERFNEKKKELAKMKEELKKYYVDAQKLKKNVSDSLNLIKKAINSVNNTAGLYEFMKENNISKNELTKAQRILLSINQVGIGRSWVDYSELSVKNISLAGINIEANPLPYYVAFAAGKVNYRFRDFIIRNNRELPDQSLYLVRAGIGQKEKNNFIMTFYNGKKAVLNYTSANDPASVQKVLGISAEARFTVNDNNYIIAEIAKSSYTRNGSQPSSSELIGKAFNLKMRTNEAYSIKLFNNNPLTGTKITAYYKKTGENFQSFNLYPINIKQDAWMFKVNQQLWKKKLVLDAAVRKNDFVSPIAAPSFSNRSVFKSFQGSLRVPKYPFVSVGYYPSSQLSLTNNNVLIENQYNTLNTVANYNYEFKRIRMNTNAMLTKFYNSSSDTNFIYFNACSWTLNQTFYLASITLQTSAFLTRQQNLDLFSMEELLSYQHKNILKLTGGLKWNRLNNSRTLLGGSAAISIQVKKMGTVQFNYDKTFLPAYNRVLMPVDIGRMTFYREF